MRTERKIEGNELKNARRKKWEIGQKEKAKLNMWRILKEVKKKLSWKKKWLNKKAIEKNY